MAAFRALDRFEPRPSLSAWLNTILIRLAARSASKAQTRPRGSLDAMLATEGGLDGMAMVAGAVPHDDPHAAAETAELRQELARAIASLPFKYRAAVVTRYILGLDYGEAASALEVGLNTYKSHLLRGTRILRNLLVDSFGERPETAPGLAGFACRKRTLRPCGRPCGRRGPRAESGGHHPLVQPGQLSGATRAPSPPERSAAARRTASRAGDLRQACGRRAGGFAEVGPPGSSIACRARVRSGADRARVGGPARLSVLIANSAGSATFHLSVVLLRV